MRPRRILGYARVSSVEQTQGTSLSDQQERIRREAAARGVKDVRFYVEAESGGYEKHERREQIRALMRAAQPGDLVVVDKLDRWSRDPEVTYRSIRELREKDVSIYFVAEALDPSTPHGEMALGMWITFARSEHRRIRERMVGTREGLQAQGYYTLGGKPPYGYRRPPVDPKNRLAALTLVPEPEEAEVVRQIFRRYASGSVSQRQLAEEYDLTIDYVNAMLSRRVYIGQVQAPPSAPGRNDGEWIKGRHEPIIDLVLFARVQEVLERRTHGGPRPHRGESETSSWILRDVATCGRCGKKMRASYRGPKGHRVYYYLCGNRYLGTRKCKAPHIRIDPVEEAAADLVVDCLAHLRDELGKPSTKRERKPPKESPAAKRAALAKKRDRLVEMYSDGVITRERMKADVARVDEALAQLEAEVAALERPEPLDDPKVRRDMLKQLSELERAVQALEPAEMRAIVNVLFERVELYGTEEARAVFRSASEIQEQLATVAEALTKSLGRAPSHAETIEALFAGMSKA